VVFLGGFLGFFGSVFYCQPWLKETEEEDSVTELRSRLANLGAIREQLATVVSTGRINLSSTAGVGNSRNASAAGNSRDASCQAGDSPAATRSLSEERTEAEEEEEEGDDEKLMEEEGEEEEDYFAGEEEEEKDDTAEEYNDDEDESEVVLRSAGHLPDSSTTEKAKVKRRRNALLGLENFLLNKIGARVGYLTIPAPYDTDNSVASVVTNNGTRYRYPRPTVIENKGLF
jgi:hypothetical protein